MSKVMMEEVAECENYLSDIRDVLKRLDESQLKVEKDAFDAINSSDTALNLVKEGMQEIECLEAKFSELNQALEKTSKNMMQMGVLTDSVAGFANTISGISSKTNMLSLNASIEAAREGEHGRGFAIVAKEVKNLAEQSAKSSKEITATIENVHNFTSELEADMKAIFEVVEIQNEVSKRVFAVFQQILKAAYVSNDVSRNMEHEIAYQRDITDSVKNTVESIYKE